DRGAGALRRARAREAGGPLSGGPDTGLFTLALLRDEGPAVAVEAPAYRGPEVSRTFHGRDIFAPAAGHLAAGVPLQHLGTRITDPIQLALPRCSRTGDEIVGEVIGIDRFGNLLTSVTADMESELAPDGAIEVALAGREISGLASNYEENPLGVAAAIVGSSGRLEIFVKNASAQAALGAAPGAEVTIRRSGSGRRL